TLIGESFARVNETVRALGKVAFPLWYPNASDDGVNTGAGGRCATTSYADGIIRQTGSTAPGPQKFIPTARTGRSESSKNIASPLPSNIAELPGGIDRGSCDKVCPPVLIFVKLSIAGAGFGFCTSTTLPAYPLGPKSPVEANNGKSG